MNTIAIDPGTFESAWCRLHNGKPAQFGIFENAGLRDMLRLDSLCLNAELVIEMMACYGMPVGQSTMETCVWIGKFEQAWESTHSRKSHRMFRQEVRQEICHNGRAKDANIRQAMIDLFGDPGTKKKPGILYGIKADEWQALALAVAWERKREKSEGKSDDDFS